MILLPTYISFDIEEGKGEQRKKIPLLREKYLVAS